MGEILHVTRGSTEYDAPAEVRLQCECCRGDVPARLLMCIRSGDGRSRYPDWSWCVTCYLALEWRGMAKALDSPMLVPVERTPELEGCERCGRTAGIRSLNGFQLCKECRRRRKPQGGR